MHKNKRRLVKDNSKRRQIIEWAVIIVFGLVIGAIGANWLNTLPVFQPHYASPGEMSLQNSMPLLVGYCLGLVAMIISGYLFMRRIDSEKTVCY
jgi:hypothetical protein